MKRTTRTPAFVATLALSCAAVLGGGSALADGERSSLTLRVTDPPPVRTYDSTALGRATHTFRLALGNPTKQSITVEPLALHFRPTRDGIAFDCGEPRNRDDRWPASLEPGSTFAFTREVACDTPLPGRYDVEIRGRARSAGDRAPERVFGSFALQIDPGPNPPVHLPWDVALFAAASGTRDLRPTKDPNAARIVVAVINGSRASVALSPLRVALRVTRRGSTATVCGERNADLPFTGTLEAGKSQTQSTAIDCDISVEAIYDVEVGLANANGTRVKIATHPIRVRVNAPDSPGPQDWQGAQFLGGS